MHLPEMITQEATKSKRLEPPRLVCHLGNARLFHSQGRLDTTRAALSPPEGTKGKG